MHSRTASVLCKLFYVALLVLSASIASRGGRSVETLAKDDTVDTQIKVDTPFKDDIQIKDAWIRWLPANLPGAGYMALTNTGSAVRVLVGASSPDYGDVSIHQTQDHNGMNEMRPVDSIILQPHATVRFDEGSYHLMLAQPKRSLHPGDRVLVALRFTEGPAITIPFEVRAGSETGTR